MSSSEKIKCKLFREPEKETNKITIIALKFNETIINYININSEYRQCIALHYRFGEYRYILYVFISICVDYATQNLNEANRRIDPNVMKRPIKIKTTFNLPFPFKLLRYIKHRLMSLHLTTEVID